MATFTVGTPVFESNGIIQLPLTFTDNVRYLSPTSFTLVGGAAPVLLGSTDHSVIGTGKALRGAGTDYILELQIPPDRRGVLSVSGAGNVVLASSGNEDPISGMASVNFDTTVPTIEDWELPTYTRNARYDAKIQFNTNVTGLSLGNEASVFQFEGASALAGAFTSYKWTGTSEPDLNTVEPADLSTTDWEQLDAAPGPPPNPPTPPFDESGNGLWHGNTLRYLLLRWASVEAAAVGLFNLTLKAETLRGPVTFT